ncbi:MAG: hypothetical protein CMB93_04265 [Flammeovirgaceae bacterium]|nr:hypothetical protein [Flammeovirgaceae bacterium]
MMRNIFAGFSRKTLYFAFICLVSTTFVSSQNLKTANDDQEELHGHEGDEVSYLYPAGSRYDERFHVDRTTFLGRLQNDGKGNLLEVSFDILNRTKQDIKLRLMVVGMYEEDTTFTLHRQNIKYPKWRKADIEGRSRHITKFDIVPVMDSEIVHKYIIDQRKGEEDGEGHLDDHDGFPMTKNEKRKKSSLFHWAEYYHFVEGNILKRGVPLTLQGSGEGKDEIREFTRLSIAEYVRRTTVYAQLFIPIQDPRQIYNVVGVFLYDENTQNIVYQKYYKFTKPLKVH